MTKENLENLLQGWLTNLDKEIEEEASRKVVDIFNTELIFHGTTLSGLYSIGYEGITSRQYAKENNLSHYSFWKVGYKRPSEICVFDPWKVVEIARQFKQNKRGDLWIEGRFGPDKIDYNLFVEQHGSPDKILEKWRNRRETIKDILNGYPVYLSINSNLKSYVSVNPNKAKTVPKHHNLRDYDNFRGEKYRAGGGWLWESVIYDYIPKENILGIILTPTFYKKLKKNSHDYPYVAWVREIIQKSMKNLRVPIYNPNGELKFPLQKNLKKVNN